MEPQRDRITHLLNCVQDDGDESWQELFELVGSELHRLARREMRNERRDHTLQPTALIHEAWLRLAGDEGSEWESRAQFFGIAGRAMRQILVDHRRLREAAKRGGGALREPLGDPATERGPSDAAEADDDLVAIHAALEKMSETPAFRRKVQVVDLLFFAGLTLDETAAALGVSDRTVSRDWSFARAWLQNEIETSSR